LKATGPAFGLLTSNRKKTKPQRQQRIWLQLPRAVFWRPKIFSPGTPPRTQFVLRAYYSIPKKVCISLQKNLIFIQQTDEKKSQLDSGLLFPYNERVVPCG
jgi:hypothetical protein